MDCDNCLEYLLGKLQIPVILLFLLTLRTQ